MTPQELIEKLKRADATELCVDFVKECYGKPADDGFDVVAVTVWDSTFSGTRYVTLHMGTPRMVSGMDAYTLDVAEGEVRL